ncbi:Multidrug resistance protein MdtF [Raoultella terrigena]|uniref:Multidrug resistance protein MdtF n=1 Tax=Raoultella terrigena TaxID=577 RepID=A0A4U9CZN5_RAOTE|nr:Multidrug resistance protein MdtF [Raoultella terrigena]
MGQLGGTPSVDKQALNATINAQSLLQTPDQFRDITLRVNQDGSEVTLGDVASVEMGAEKYDYLSRYNRQAHQGWVLSSPPAPTKWPPPSGSSPA